VNRPGVTVRNRSGYYAPDATPRAAKAAPAPVAPVERAIGQGLPSGDLPVTMAATVLPAPGQKTPIVAVVTGFTLPVHDTVPSVEVLTAAFDSEWHVRGTERQTVAVTARDVASDGIRYVASRLNLPPGRYELRVAVDGHNGHTGNVFTDVDVPDFAKAPLSASGLVLDVTPATSSTPPDAFADVLPVTPTVRRAFARTDRVTTFLRVNQGGKAILRQVQIAARVVNDRDEMVFASPSVIEAARFGTDRSADYRLDVPVASFAPGNYLLTWTATEDLRSVERTMRFSIEP
jgi:hypothetical protein